MTFGGYLYYIVHVCECIFLLFLYPAKFYAFCAKGEFFKKKYNILLLYINKINVYQKGKTQWSVFPVRCYQNVIDFNWTIMCIALTIPRNTWHFQFNFKVYQPTNSNWNFNFKGRDTFLTWQKHHC